MSVDLESLLALHKAAREMRGTATAVRTDSRWTVRCADEAYEPGTPMYEPEGLPIVQTVVVDPKVANPNDAANAKWIAAAVNALPQLVADVRALRAERDASRVEKSKLLAIAAKERDALKARHVTGNQGPCAKCGERKPLPYRRDDLGGYVCLTCVERYLSDTLADVARAADVQRALVAEVARLKALLGRADPVRCSSCGEVRERAEGLCGNCTYPLDESAVGARGTT